jgi:hypothetical protein
MLAGCFLLLGFRAAAADPDVISAPVFTPPVREIPILTSPETTGSDGHFQLTIDPIIFQRAPGATGDLADSTDEHFDFGWHFPLSGILSLGYDTGVNAFRQDQTIWDDEEATSEVTTAFINKGSLNIQTGPMLKWTAYVQGQQSLADGQPGFSDATKYGTEAAWTPLKDVTTVKVQASTQETYNLNRGVLDENLYTTSLDQKLPYIPFTLHTAGSLTDDTAPMLTGSDKASTIIDASLLWKIVPATSLSGGVQRQDTTIPATITLQNTNVYFTQVALQPAKAWTLTMRAAHEQRASTQAGQFLSDGSDVLLSFGLTWTLSDRFNAGAGLNYRVLQSQAPAAAQSTPPATFSITAGGKF